MEAGVVLRLIFAVLLILYGLAQSLRGPFYALLFYLGIAYFRPEFWVWGDELQGLNLSFFVGLYAVASTLFFRDRFTFGTPALLIAIFCIHGLVSTLLSPYFDWCIIWWQGFAKVAVVSILIIGLVNTEARFRLALLVITLALGFEGVKQGWAFLVLGIDNANANPIEILGDNNGVAVGMLMLAAVVLSLLQTAPTLRKKGFFAFILIGVLFRSLTTYSRGGLLAFGAMLIAYWLRSTKRLQTAIVVGTLGLVLLPLLPPAYWTRMSTITAAREEMDNSAAGRLHFWGVAVDMANAHPLFGVGNLGFQAAYNQFDTSGGDFGYGRAVHSTWFGVLADQGYVGLAVLVTLIVSALWACGRVRRIVRDDPDRRALFVYAGGLQAAILAVIVGGSFLSYHYVEILWHFMALSFALARIATEEAAVPLAEPAAAFGATHAYETS
jgi:probable O-glycosylation ligase (exosortase A-associated)